MKESTTAVLSPSGTSVESEPTSAFGTPSSPSPSSSAALPVGYGQVFTTTSPPNAKKPATLSILLPTPLSAPIPAPAVVFDHMRTEEAADALHIAEGSIQYSSTALPAVPVLYLGPEAAAADSLAAADIRHATSPRAAQAMHSEAFPHSPSRSRSNSGSRSRSGSDDSQGSASSADNNNILARPSVRGILHNRGSGVKGHAHTTARSPPSTEATALSSAATVQAIGDLDKPGSA